MAEKMTIFDALEAYELYDLYEDIIDVCESEFYSQSEEVEADLRDLIEENDDVYEFTPDEEGDYSESFERNLKEAISIIFDDHGLEAQFEEDFMDEDMADDDMYTESLEDAEQDDGGGFGEDEDEMY